MCSRSQSDSQHLVPLGYGAPDCAGRSEGEGACATSPTGRSIIMGTAQQSAGRTAARRGQHPARIAAL